MTRNEHTGTTHREEELGPWIGAPGEIVRMIRAEGYVEIPFLGAPQEAFDQLYAAFEHVIEFLAKSPEYVIRLDAAVAEWRKKPGTRTHFGPFPPAFRD